MVVIQKQKKYVEKNATLNQVRVGHTNAGSVTGLRKRICVNRVCHTTGPSEV